MKFSGLFVEISDFDATALVFIMFYLLLADFIFKFANKLFQKHRA